VLKSHQAKKENIVSPVKVQNSKGFGFFCAPKGRKRLVAAGDLIFKGVEYVVCGLCNFSFGFYRLAQKEGF
jgi:hypothetical protein